MVEHFDGQMEILHWPHVLPEAPVGGEVLVPIDIAAIEGRAVRLPERDDAFMHVAQKHALRPDPGPDPRVCSGFAITTCIKQEPKARRTRRALAQRFHRFFRHVMGSACVGWPAGGECCADGLPADVLPAAAFAGTARQAASVRAAHGPDLCFTLFVPLGIHLPSFPLWLQANGFDAEQIAIILAAPMFLRVVTS